MPDIYKYGCDRNEDNEKIMMAFLMDVCPQTRLEDLTNIFILFVAKKIFYTSKSCF